MHDVVAGAQRTTPARAVAQHVYRANGIRGFYRGLSATILRDVGGYGLYFSGVRPYLPLPLSSHL
jgi:Mitochondrial carrier protein